MEKLQAALQFFSFGKQQIINVMLHKRLPPHIIVMTKKGQGEHEMAEIGKDMALLTAGTKTYSIP